MNLDDFLAAHPLDDEGAPERPQASASTPVPVTGRLVSADDDVITVQLGRDLLAIPREAVVDIEPDAAPPVVDVGAVYVVVRIDPAATLRVERFVDAAGLAGVGLRPFVAARPTRAPSYAMAAAASNDVVELDKMLPPRTELTVYEDYGTLLRVPGGPSSFHTVPAHTAPTVSYTSMPSVVTTEATTFSHHSRVHNDYQNDVETDVEAAGTDDPGSVWL